MIIFSNLLYIIIFLEFIFSVILSCLSVGVLLLRGWIAIHQYGHVEFWNYKIQILIGIILILPLVLFFLIRYLYNLKKNERFTEVSIYSFLGIVTTSVFFYMFNTYFGA